MECRHEDAVFSLEFNRFSDEQGIPRKFTADLTIRCSHCGCRFTFSEPVISGDEATLSATIAPEEVFSETLDLRDLFLERPPEE